MFAIVAALLALAEVDESAADRIVDAFRPGLDWIARWLPLFYVPIMVTVPLAAGTVPPTAAGRILLSLVLGGLGSLVATAQARKQSGYARVDPRPSRATTLSG